jgi:virulence factor Mce-like protein
MRRAKPRFSLGNDVTAIGWVTILVVSVAVFLSYNANNGLPFVPTYQVAVDVPDAAQLVRGDDVRVGGALVGQVQKITALERRGARPPSARLMLALKTGLAPLPRDSRAQVRPVSILGGKYLALEEGRSRAGIPQGGALPLARARPIVDLDEALQIFDRETRRGVQGVVSNLGEGVAGRGVALNETVSSTRRLLPPLQSVLEVVAAPGTDLEGFIDGAASATGTLEPVSGTLGDFVENGAVTLTALDAADPALGQSLEELPPTEQVGTRVLRRLTPLLIDSAALARELRPAVTKLPATSRLLQSSLREGTRTLRGRTRGRLDPLVSAFGELGTDPASIGTVRKTKDVIGELDPVIRFTSAAQLNCNVLPVWARNLASIGSEGDAAGSWINLLPVVRLQQMLPSGTQDPELHLNPYPNQNARECEAGNEPYGPGKLVGNPPGAQR